MEPSTLPPDDFSTGGPSQCAICRGVNRGAQQALLPHTRLEPIAHCAYLCSPQVPTSHLPALLREKLWHCAPFLLLEPCSPILQVPPPYLHLLDGRFTPTTSHLATTTSSLASPRQPGPNLTLPLKTACQVATWRVFVHNFLPRGF